MIKILNKIWSHLNGNKTIICSIVIILAQWMRSKDILLDIEAWNMIINLFGILGGASFAHHIKKGSFKVNSK